MYTKKDAIQIAKQHGFSFKYDAQWNEYRVTKKGISNAEESAYYTDDLQDAVGTMLLMAQDSLAGIAA